MSPPTAGSSVRSWGRSAIGRRSGRGRRRREDHRGDRRGHGGSTAPCEIRCPVGNPSRRGGGRCAIDGLPTAWGEGGVWQAGSVSTPAQTPGDQGAFRRDESLRRLADEPFDVVVVGGGITGAGVALDAASRGLRTALVEKGDFASGTSSKSSKMIHGGPPLPPAARDRPGLREPGRAPAPPRERPAPGHPAPLPHPALRPRRRGLQDVARSYSTALWLYDLTGGLRIGKRHRRVTKAEALAHMPTLRTDHLVAGFLYLDARADDARLTLDPGAHRRPRPRRRRRQLHRPPAFSSSRGRVDGVTVRPRPGPGGVDGGSEFDDPRPRGGERHRGVGRRGPGPRRGRPTRSRSGRPRAST